VEAGTASQAVWTGDLSAFGFSAIIDTRDEAWRGPISFRLTLPHGRIVAGTARLAGNKPPAAESREGFVITDLGDDDRRAIADVVFDQILEQIRL
jgi:hypothetical protein